MSDPTYYRFDRGYKPIEATSFEEAKSKLMQLIIEDHALEMQKLVDTSEEKDRWSKCGCTGWRGCKTTCPEYQIAF